MKGLGFNVFYLAVISIAFILVPGAVFGISMSGLQADSSIVSPVKIFKAAQTLSIEQLDSTLSDGNVFVLMSMVENAEISDAKPADIHAIKAIVFAAQENSTSSKSELSSAKKGKANKRYIAYAEAMLLRMDKKYEEALRVCKGAINYKKDYPYPWNILGRIYLDQQDYTMAIESFNKAIALNSNIFPAYLNLGAAYYYTGQFDLAITTFERATAINAMENRAYYGQTLAYEQLGKYREAISALKKYLSLTEVSPEALEHMARLQTSGEDYDGLLNTGQILANKGEEHGFIVQSNAYLHLGQLKNAEDVLSSMKYESAEKYYLLGLSQMLKGEFAKALKHMETVLRSEPDHFGAFSARLVIGSYLRQGLKPAAIPERWSVQLNRLIAYYMGNSAIAQGDFVKAKDYWTRAEGLLGGFTTVGLELKNLDEANNRDAVALINLGTYYYFANFRNKARIAFSQALKKIPDSSFANYWIAQLFLEKGNRNSAQKHLKRSVGKNEFFPSLYSLAELSLLKGDRNSAKSYYQRAIKIKEDAGIFIKLGLLSEQESDFENAARMYNKVINISPELYIGYNQLAWLYTKRGVKLDEALSLAGKANTLQPENASILDTLGWIHYLKKDVLQAKNYLTRANQASPNNPTILYHLGATYKMLGYKEVAQKHLKSALVISGSFEGADLARKLLN